MENLPETVFKALGTLHPDRQSRLAPYVLALIFLFSAIPAQAGEEKATVETKEVKAMKLEEPWDFMLGIPIWIAGISGKVGVHGKTSEVDVDPGTILSKLNFTASFSGEARKGPFGVYADFLYLNDRSGQTRSGLVSKVDLQVDEYLTDFDLDWRVINGPKGWLDVLAGFRYTNLYDKVGLQTASGATEAASSRFVDVTNDQVRTLLDRELNGALDLKNPNLPVPPLAADQEAILVDLIQRAKNDPLLIAALNSQVQARIDAAKAIVRDRITRALNQSLNRSYTLAQEWVDPYVGLRARYNFTKAFYLTAKADVGGFGIGSQVTTQVYGALGWQINRSIFAETGYRYLYVNYRNGGFVYDVSTSGAQIKLGILF